MAALILFPVGGGVISPCLSLFVTVRRRQRIGSDSLAIPNLYSVSGGFVLGLPFSISVCLQAATKSWDRLEDTINPGYNVLSRYRKCGEGWDLERTIEQFERALNVCPLDHLCRAAARSNLEMTDFTRCLVEGTGPFHDVSLGLYRDALTTRPIGNFGRPSTLIRLAAVHLARFDKRQDKVGAALAHENVNLSSAESHGHQAATLLPSLYARDKVDSIQARDQSSVKHDFPPSLTYVDPWTSSFQLLLRFKLLGDLADLQQAISILETIIKTVPLSDQRHPFGLEILGMAYRYRFDRLGELSDLEKAISKFGSVVDFLPDGDTLKPACLNNLGIAFRTRFERLGELSDLERAISRLENAVHLTQSNPEKADYLNNLGIAFGARFEHLGKLDDLEEAISRQRNAVDLTPHGHPHKPAVLNNLGTSFLTRFERLGELCDLEQGISRFRDAIDLTPDGHPDKPFRLNNIGNSFRTRFKHLGELSDLERAISRHREAVDLIPHGLRKPACLNNLGSSFFTRFEMLGKLDDLEQAISNLADAVDLIPRDHPDKRTYLNNLGVSLQTRFGRLRKLSDLDQAILMQMDAIDLTPDDHPDRPRYLGNLGNSFLSRFQHLDELSDLEQAISRYSRAACSAIGPTIDRFHASQAWISCARSPRHPSLLHAYSVSIGLLPKLAWIGLSLAHRYRELIRGADVVREAAATAVESGHLKIAVEWLEQGRSIVWGELLQLRGSYDELAGAYPDHARRLRELSTALEQASSTRERILSALSEHAQSSGHRVIESLQQEADRHRMLAIDRDKVLCNIREFPGFERFLLHTEFSQLRASAHSGPVVILNAAETRCDALVVLADAEDVIHVPFPNFSLRRSRGLQNALKNLLGPARIIRSDTRKGRPVSRTQINWEFLLAILWKGVVKPVLDALGFSVRAWTVSVLADSFIQRFQTEPRAPFAHFLVSYRAFCVSSYPCGGSLWHSVFGARAQGIRFRHFVVHPYCRCPCPSTQIRCIIQRRSSLSFCPPAIYRWPIPPSRCGRGVGAHRGNHQEFSINANCPYGVYCRNCRGSTRADEARGLGPLCMPRSPRCCKPDREWTMPR